MNAKAMITMALVGGQFAAVGRASEVARADIAVCMGDNISLFVAGHAQMEASAIFRQIGIHLNWHSANSAFCRKSKSPMIQVTYSLKTGDQVDPGALAHSMPYEGVHIEVFYDRVRGKTDIGVSHVLAHVLAHEISHVLQGNDRHSDLGIMKARWDKADFAKMETRTLPFANNDILRMHEDLQAWAKRAQPAAFSPLAKP